VGFHDAVAFQLSEHFDYALAPRPYDGGQFGLGHGGSDAAVDVADVEGVADSCAQALVSLRGGQELQGVRVAAVMVDHGIGDLRVLLHDPSGCLEAEFPSPRLRYGALGDGSFEVEVLVGGDDG